jgi:dihydroxyacetone kinase-like protein
MAMKKLINDPYEVTDELVEGFVLAYSDRVKRIGDLNVVARKDAPIEGKVGIVIGGGSGHEPLFLGCIGKGMADTIAHGNIFAAPSPDLALEAARAADGGAGVIFLYNNYTGDRLNFDMAQEMAQDEGIQIDTILIYDDIASAPKGRETERRGTTADLLVIKTAGAVAETMVAFEEVKRVIKKAVDNSRSLGVALTPCTIPATGQPTFEIGDDEMEVGMGLHGEKGVQRMKLMSADETTELMINRIVEDLPFKSGDEIIFLINGYGSTTLMEMFIINRKARAMFKDMGIKVYATEIGNFCTSQEMAGCSLTLMRIDDELKRYYDAPADCPAYVKMGKS